MKPDNIQESMRDKLDSFRKELDDKINNLRIELSEKIENKMSITIALVAAGVIIGISGWFFRCIANTGERVARTETRLDTVEKASPQLPSQNASKGWLK